MLVAPPLHCVPHIIYHMLCKECKGIFDIMPNSQNNKKAKVLNVLNLLGYPQILHLATVFQVFKIFTTPFLNELISSGPIKGGGFFRQVVGCCCCKFSNVQNPSIAIIFPVWTKGTVLFISPSALADRLLSIPRIVSEIHNFQTSDWSFNSEQIVVGKIRGWFFL